MKTESIQQDMIVSCLEILRPMQINQTSENYIFLYKPDTKEEFVYGFGQYVYPGKHKYIFWGARNKTYQISVKKNIQLELVVDTYLPVLNIDRSKILEQPRFKIQITAFVRKPLKLLQLLDKQELNLSAIELFSKNIRHIRKAIEEKYKGGSLSVEVFRDTYLERILERLGTLMTNVKLISLNNRKTQK